MWFSSCALTALLGMNQIFLPKAGITFRNYPFEAGINTLTVIARSDSNR
jgi:hypothetical protein